MWPCELRGVQDLTRPPSDGSELQIWRVRRTEAGCNVQHSERPLNAREAARVTARSYKAVTFAVKLASAGEEHGAGRHVDTHGEGLGSK